MILSFAVETESRRHVSSQPWTYRDLDRRQRQIARRVCDGGPGALLLSEVAPVITAGRRAVLSDLAMGPEELKSAGIDYYPVDRGGLATYHGPGQWVLFAVDSLERLVGDCRGVRKAVGGLLESAQEAVKEICPAAQIREGAETGLWTDGGQKLASVGVHIEEGVLLHGLSLNVFRTRDSFFGLRRPCGLDAGPGFLFDELTPIEADWEFERVGRCLERAVFSHFWL